MTKAAFRPHLRLKKSSLPALEQESMLAWIKDIFTQTVDQQHRIEAHILLGLTNCPDEAQSYKTSNQRCVERLQHAEQTLAVVEEQDFWLVSFEFKNDHAIFEQIHADHNTRVWLRDEIEITVLRQLNTSVTMIMMSHMAGNEYEDGKASQKLINDLGGFIEALEGAMVSCLKVAPGEFNPMYFIGGEFNDAE